MGSSGGGVQILVGQIHPIDRPPSKFTMRAIFLYPF